MDYTPANITQVWLFHLLVRHTVLFQNDVMCDGSIHYKFSTPIARKIDNQHRWFVPFLRCLRLEYKPCLYLRSYTLSWSFLLRLNRISYAASTIAFLPQEYTRSLQARLALDRFGHPGTPNISSLLCSTR